MIELAASAPGKLVLLGEYAVLEGFPALALAVDRRARVRLALRNDGLCRVHAPQVGVDVALAEIDADACLHWRDASRVAARLHLVGEVWNGLARQGWLDGLRSGCELAIDTAGFVHDIAGANAKLGLGSSAALGVALASALVRAAGHATMPEDRETWLTHLIRLHAHWQGGQGSGIDLAAALHGGLIVYRRMQVDVAPIVQSWQWPAGLHRLFVWSGTSVSTSGYLQRLGRWREEEPVAYARHLRELGAQACAAMDALALGAAEFVAALGEFAAALAAFAAASGLAIWSPTQCQVAMMARRHGVVFKPCGAGGDIGVALSEDAERLAMLRRSIMAAGLQPLALEDEVHGLQWH